MKKQEIIVKIEVPENLLKQLFELQTEKPESNYPESANSIEDFAKAFYFVAKGAKIHISDIWDKYQDWGYILKSDSVNTPRKLVIAMQKYLGPYMKHIRTSKQNLWLFE